MHHHHPSTCNPRRMKVIGDVWSSNELGSTRKLVGNRRNRCRSLGLAGPCILPFPGLVHLFLWLRTLVESFLPFDMMLRGNRQLTEQKEEPKIPYGGRAIVKSLPSWVFHHLKDSTGERFCHCCSAGGDLGGCPVRKQTYCSQFGSSHR